jgi:nitroreductase
MELLDAINQRHLTREYFPETPSDEMVEKLVNAAIRAPSAVNRSEGRVWFFSKNLGKPNTQAVGKY